jgi:hypothetical protein
MASVGVLFLSIIMASVGLLFLSIIMASVSVLFLYHGICRLTVP